MVKKYFVFAILIFIQNVVNGQSDTLLQGANEITIIPGKQYASGSLHKFFFGKHWRDLWTTPIKIEVIDLRKFAGGLTPTKKGGGLQSKSLRLRGEDGNEYKFRLIDKNPVSSLPKELQRSIYADVIQDQVSIGIPASSLIVYPLMKSTGILSPEPEIFFMPYDSKLSFFQSDFGGQAGVIEINPRAGKEGLKNFENANKVVNGFEIFEKTEKDNDEQVDAAEFLKARLMDAFIGDRDRHSDQWQWAGYETDGKRIWKPIPRDRDYAFAKYDGAFPFVSTLLVHSLVSFNEDYPSMLELTWSGRHLDRRYLNSLDKKVWDSVAYFLISNLSDSVIADAVRQMPPEMFYKEGKNLIKTLKSRRDKLKAASDEFYKVYSKVIDVYGSNKNEIAEVNSINDKEVEIKIYKKDKQTGAKKGKPFFERKFYSQYTNEIRLNMLNGKDDIIVKGKSGNDLLLRVITQDGYDDFENESDMKIKLYDNGSKIKIKSSESIYYNDDKIFIPKKPELRYEPPLEDRYGFIAYTPVFNYNTDDGFILGFGPNYTQFGFRANPYLYYLQATGAYATKSSDYDFRFYGDFYKVIHKARLQFFLKASELDFNRYYGFGNETIRNEELAEENFYKTNQQDYFIKPIVSLNISTHSKINFSFKYDYSNVTINPDELVGIQNPYGTGKHSTFSIGCGVSYLVKDNPVFPRKGFGANFEAVYCPAILNNQNNFGIVTADAINYLNFKFITNNTLLLRAGGELIMGSYPFYFGAKLGGLRNLRGFSRERFLGDGLVFGQSELRIGIASINLFFPSRIGISAMSDIGRVFLKGEDSQKWHSTYGGGVWINIVNTIILNFTAAVSPELINYYFTTGFTL